MLRQRLPVRSPAHRIRRLAASGRQSRPPGRTLRLPEGHADPPGTSTPCGCVRPAQNPEGRDPTGIGVRLPQACFRHRGCRSVFLPWRRQGRLLRLSLVGPSVVFLVFSPRLVAPGRAMHSGQSRRNRTDIRRSHRRPFRTFVEQCCDVAIVPQAVRALTKSPLGVG